MKRPPFVLQNIHLLSVLAKLTLKRNRANGWKRKLMMTFFGLNCEGKKKSNELWKGRGGWQLCDVRRQRKRQRGGSCHIASVSLSHSLPATTLIPYCSTPPLVSPFSRGAPPCLSSPYQPTWSHWGLRSWIPHRLRFRQTQSGGKRKATSKERDDTPMVSECQRED